MVNHTLKYLANFTNKKRRDFKSLLFLLQQSIQQHHIQHGYEFRLTQVTIHREYHITGITTQSSIDSPPIPVQQDVTPVGGVTSIHTSTVKPHDDVTLIRGVPIIDLPLPHSEDDI